MLGMFTVDLWSEVGLAFSAGVCTSLVLVIAPSEKHRGVHLVLLGSYAGTVVWVLERMVRMRMGENVTGKW
jgi:hypothetical protein